MCSREFGSESSEGLKEHGVAERSVEHIVCMKECYRLGLSKFGDSKKNGSLLKDSAVVLADSLVVDKWGNRC